MREVYQKPTKEDIALDKKYLAWLRKQQSAISSVSPCQACHYRTAKNSGTGCKPLFSAIPLTAEEHKEQHRIGQYNFMPREWWEEQVEYYLRKWRDSNNIAGR